MTAPTIHWIEGPDRHAQADQIVRQADDAGLGYTLKAHLTESGWAFEIIVDAPADKRRGEGVEE